MQSSSERSAQPIKQDPPGCFHQRGHCVQHKHSTVSLPAQVSHHVNQQLTNIPPAKKKKDTKAERSKACSDYWLSGGLALRKWFLDKGRALGSCSRKRSTCLSDRSGASGTTLLTSKKSFIILAAEIQMQPFCTMTTFGTLVIVNPNP